VKVGDQFEIVVNALHYPARAVAARDTFATLAPDAVFAIASRQQLKAVHPDAQLIPTTYFLDAPESAGPAIRDAVNAIDPGATVMGRAETARAFSDSPVTAAIVVGIALAGIIAALYAALAVAAALALAGDARAVEAAHLRALGLSRREASGLAIVEHGPIVILAFILGVALTADPRQLAVILGSVVVIAGVGLGLAAWMQRRGTATSALRRGFE
jgi:predicted lysophospholipase L1 biosynthesis ABC-type transport system permease subunit